MNTRSFKRQDTKGSTLITVIFLIAMMGMLTGSILLYSGGENRANNRNRLILRARNMAENIALYASEQMTTKLYRVRNANPRAFMSNVVGVPDANTTNLPPNSVLTTQFTTPGGMEVRAGIPAAGSAMAYIDPALPGNAGNPNVGLQASNSVVQIIAKATATHPVLGSVTAFAEQDLELATIPLFQFAVFYNMDMEYGPGGDMVISGPVHTNGNLIARDQTGRTNKLEFQNRVTTAKGFFANTAYKGPTVMNTGSADNGPGGTGPLYFTSESGVKTNIFNGSIWRDHFYGVAYTTPATSTTIPPASSLASFKTFATTTYGNNLRTSVHGVTPLVLPAISNYQETDNPATPEDDRNNGRQVIEAPSLTDTAGLAQSKISRNAGLYIIVNPTSGILPNDGKSRVGILPDGSTQLIRPYSYRCFLSTLNNDLTYTIAEVVLPGQPTYGYNDNGTPADTTDDYMYKNVLPNQYVTNTSVGSNQVLRIPQQPAPIPVPVLLAPASATPAANTGYTHTVTPTYTSFEDAYFYDIRRAANSYPTNRTNATPYTPRPITKIDVDMTRFRMMAERTLDPVNNVTSTVYYPSLPINSTQWSHFIYNPSATSFAYGLGMGASFDVFPTALTPTAPDPFRIYFAPANKSDPLLLVDPRTFAVAPSYLFNTILPSPWRDGIAVYVYSADAEDRSLFSPLVPNRNDSGVRLWNGRGPIASLPAATTLTGLTIATNDAIYIIGHFNADGTINSNSTSTANPGGYSAVYPDSTDEFLTSVMGDATTILSQPTFSSGGGGAPPYRQIDGWADSLSSHVAGTTASTGSWQTSNPSGSNAIDGINNNQKPGDMPNLSIPSTNGSVSNQSRKFAPVDTEISTCLVVGIVPTNANPAAPSNSIPVTYVTNGPPSAGPNGQTSGGVHNYPRLSEVWGSAGLYFRGSMVAMFESRVAMEPWGIRYYSAPGRYWGLHANLQAAGPVHHLPLEPMLLNARRMRYLELTENEYNAKKAIIEALPH